MAVELLSCRAVELYSNKQRACSCMAVIIRNESGVIATYVVFVQQENCMVFVNTHQMQHMKCPWVHVGGDWGIQEHAVDPSCVPTRQTGL